ncbi:hypothetical protein [Streptomyces sp. NBC_00233]|uniref:hypothetical protein n=1 Tax=Streptomyces sp. NBC_00233 TaxID=2975686 RepID=UPI002257D030|nr:hypothetical protein [Streptomyces sp. NBC_00233]MCX5233549.1 hypothetical protein [Streptomyces sp. NBC_00233]
MRSVPAPGSNGAPPDGPDDREAGLLDWLVPDGQDVSSLSTADVERFCWYELPHKWHADQTEQQELLRSLARLLTRAGRPRPAAVCTTETTAGVLRSWRNSPQEGIAACRKAMADSPITPPDTPELAWGEVMGTHESIAHANASIHLEQALDAGDLDPDARGFRAARIHLTEQWLTTPHPAHHGCHPLDAIRAERRDVWQTAPPAERRNLLAPVLHALDRPLPTPADTAEPLCWLLQAIGDGVPLTQAGYLPSQLVAEAFARYPHWYPIGKGPRSEADLFQLAHLHEIARHYGLLTRRHRTVKLSAAGRTHLTDPELRQNTAVFAWLGADRAQHQAAEAAACALWPGPLPHDALEHAVHHVLTASLRHADGTPITHDDTLRLLWQWLHTGQEMGYLHRERSFRQPTALTTTGRPAALALLRRLAQAPQHPQSM